MSERNAELVVASWQRGEHVGQWGKEALERKPSELNALISITWRSIAHTIDQQADGLANIGFLPGHSVMRELRKEASLAAGRANRASDWAEELKRAEATACLCTPTMRCQHHTLP